MTRDHILAVCVAIKDCWLIDTWESEFHQAFLENPDPKEKVFAHNVHARMWRAALLFSLIALRKVADFAENRGTKSDDIKLSSFGLNLKTLTGHSQVIDGALRDKINKGIAHLTSDLDPDNEELNDLREDLKSRERILQVLEDRFFSMI